MLKIRSDRDALTEQKRRQFDAENVSTLWIFIPDNYGADRSLISYIGLSGVATGHRRRAVDTVYELLCVGDHNDPLKEKQGDHIGHL